MLGRFSTEAHFRAQEPVYRKTATKSGGMRREIKMLSHSSQGIANTSGKTRRRWNKLLAFLCFSLFLTSFFFGSVISSHAASFQILILSATGGSTDPVAGSYFVEGGQSFTVKSQPDGGHKFLKWTIAHYEFPDSTLPYKTTESYEAELTIDPVTEGLDITPNFAFNNPPVATNDNYITDEDTGLTVAAPGVLGNDTDVDADPLTAVKVDDPSHGSVTLNADGSFTYTPNPDINGSDTFTYKANDGTADSNVATVTITVNTTNDAPVAINDSYTTDEDTALTVAALGVLGNDTDVDGDTLTAIQVSNPSHGSLTLNTDGSFTYTPNANFNGSDTFTYKANDGTADSNVATVTITVNAVNDAPVATSDSYTTDEDAPLTVGATGVLDNDSDVDGDTLTAVKVSDPSNGSVTLNADGSFTYTSNPDFNGSTSFTYKVNDGTADSNIATVTITVNAANDAPVAVNDSYTTDEDTGLTVAAPGVLGNDTDVDADPLTAVKVDDPSHGSLTLNADGSFTYTPNADFNGSDTFTYKANDGTADSNVATVTITVNAVNDVPTDISLSNAGVDENQAVGTVVGTFSTTDQDTVDTHTYTLVAGAGSTDNSSFSISGTQLLTAASFDYETKASHSILIQTDDGNGGTFSKQFTISVSNLNEAPTDITLSNTTVAENSSAGALVGNLSSTDVDSGDTFTYTLVAGTGSDDNASFTISGDQLQTAGDFDFENKSSYSVRVRTTDAGGLYYEEVFTISVIDVNEAPAADFSASPLSGPAPLTVNFTDLSTDVDSGDIITGWTWDFGDTGTAAVQNPTHEYAQSGLYTVSLTATDQGSVTGTTTKTEYIAVHLTIRMTNPGTGTGTVDVAVTPSGLSAGTYTIPAGGSVDLVVAHGDTVTLANPQASGDSIFIAANSDVPDTIGSASGVVITKRAEFQLKRTITVTNPGSGSGTVTVVSCTPSGLETGNSLPIGPGGSVVFNVAQGDTVSLGASAATANDYFEGFNGDKSGITPIAPSVVMNGDQTVTATFKKGLTLTINWVGIGSGTVATSDGGILPLSPFVGGSSTGGQGTTASYACLEGDVIHLEAADFFFPSPPVSGSKFKGWGGDASGTDYGVDILMDTNKTVTVNFNATYILSINKGGSGEGRGEVEAGTGSASSLAGGLGPGTYLYEAGDQVPLSATDIDPTLQTTGCEFQNWTVGYGEPGAGFASGSQNTPVTISGDLSVTGNFRGKYMITSLARLGGTITPVGEMMKYHGESQLYEITANANYVGSDLVVDGISQGATAKYTFSELSANHTIIAVFVLKSDYIDTVTAGDDQIYAITVPPLVLMVMGRNHKLYYEAYNDASDLDGDSTLDVRYNPKNIDYYGYFDSYKVYKYDEGNGRFYPVGTTQTKKVNPDANDEWSGDFLNYVTMSRIDVLRKVLYGGYRSVDTVTETVLMRSFIPQDAHSWGKEYESPDVDGYDIRDYTPLELPSTEFRRVRHLFANTTPADPLSDKNDPQPDLNRPLLRVLNDSTYRIWEWVSIERPVAGEKCIDGTIGPNCATAAVPAGFHPGHPANALEFQALVNEYAVPEKQAPDKPGFATGNAPGGKIDGQGNPWGLNYDPYDPSATDQTNYLTIFRGNIVPTTPGDYYFAVNGANAVEVLINGTVVAGKYGSDGVTQISNPKQMPHASDKVKLFAGVNTVELRQEVSTGGGSYTLYWKGPDSKDWQVIPSTKYADLKQSTYELLTTGTPESTMKDYVVKVVVCDPSLPEPNGKKYPSGVSKPIGLLQKFGEPGKMFFGLLTGSYAKNISGGVLRKRIGTVTDEIDPNTGRFRYKYDSTYSNDKGDIIKTIDGFRIADYLYKYYAYGNPDTAAWATSRKVMAEGDSPDWGNPIAEMMYEGLRYYAGKKAPTGVFNYTATSVYDVQLGLSQPTWDDPYESSLWCAKPFMLVLSDINPNFDSDQLPGANVNFIASNFSGSVSSFDATPADFSAEPVADGISTAEGVLGNHYIGQVATTFDSSCSPKNMDAHGFGKIRGLCSEEPTKQGSYHAPAAAFFGRSHDMNPIEEEQNVITYSVAMASPLPRIEIPVAGQTITLVPFGNSVHGCLGVNPTGGYNPSITIVDFYIEALSTTNGIIRINFADIEHGGYHDLDAIVIYRYQVIDDNGDPVEEDPSLGTGVKITLQSEYGSSCLVMHVGYIISGTTADGTYLEVRSISVPDTEDMDYFLDTPPDGYDMPGLPLSATRIFYPGETTAATLLNDPLWYAAKWGGFTDLNDNKVPDLESEWDQDGDGVPDTYFYVVNPLRLERQLTRAFADILSRGVSHVAPAVSVDEHNRTQSGDSLYMAFFKPISENYWQGNLKKYGLDFLTREDCGTSRAAAEWTVVDQDGLIAGECDGLFKSTSRSFWSSEMDGGYVDRGGVGERLLAAMPGSDPVYPPDGAQFWDFRNIYTYKGAADGSMARFIHENISNADLNVGDDYTRYRIINFLYGYTYDSKSATDQAPREKRPWILGDIIHSEPKILDYINPENGALDYRYVVVGANDGMLHVFDDETGDEIFAFIPGDLLPRLQELSSPSTHVHMIDGPIQILRSDEIDTTTGYYKKTLVFGERRGGRSYWALDITNPIPTDWTVKWSITGGEAATGGTAGFEELGQTWSRPLFTKMRISADTVKDAFVFAGGYDIQEDGFPEAFSDLNEDGVRDSDEPHSVTVGGTEGYDRYNPDKNSYGRGIFVVDADTGEILFKATYGEMAVTTGTDQKHDDMKFCFPADVSLVPLSDTSILIYAADVYANIWKITYNYFAEAEAVPYSAISSRRWTVKRIFTSNPGSNMSTGVPDAFASASLNSSDAGRKAFYSPDVSLSGNEWTNRPVLYYGTGDREHPRYTMISNRFYVMADADTATDETDLINITCDELDDNTDANGDGIMDDADDSLKYALTDLLHNGPALGWYRVLDAQTNCSQEFNSHLGESVLSRPTVFFENIYFTTYQPTFGDPCTPLGNAFLYALDYSFGTSAFNYNSNNDSENEIRNITDTYRMITGTSIPSGVKVVIRDGHSAGFVSVGGSLVGVGEDGSSTIPGPPGGVTPLVWETD